MEKLTKLNNPYIIKLIEAEETETQFLLVVEYISGGELLSFIKERKGVCEDQAHKFFTQILSAIECCHHNRIIHRDIKLQVSLLNFGAYC
jgi:5'-AMP-activated protein kinase catalytic alpha subunit